MTWLEKEVPSLELCKKLKKLGYPQENGGYWWYEETETGEFFVDTSGFPVRSQRIVCVAPTIRELVKWVDKSSLADEFVYYPSQINPNEFARDVIWLEQHGYIDFKKEEKNGYK